MLDHPIHIQLPASTPDLKAAVQEWEKGLEVKVRREILRAETRAESILKRNWAVVANLTAAVLRSPSGRLGQKRLLRLLAPLRQSQSVAVGA